MIYCDSNCHVVKPKCEVIYCHVVKPVREVIICFNFNTMTEFYSHIIATKLLLDRIKKLSENNAIRLKKKIFRLRAVFVEYVFRQRAVSLNSCFLTISPEKGLVFARRQRKLPTE